MAAQPLNIILIAVWAYAQIRRSLYEEQLLIQSEEYREYTQKVPWRFIPGVI
jgi:protein-S-isoprenylcysteine O-methyltransferase Ste14